MIMKEIARDLRTNPTDAERHLWYHLRNKHLHDLRFRRQHPIDNYVVDFVCFEKKLIVELDGGQHNEDDVMCYDDERTLHLKKQGYCVLRFWNDEVFEQTDAVLSEILRCAEER